MRWRARGTKPVPIRRAYNGGAVRSDHRHQRRRAALSDLRHQDASERQLLRLRGLRIHQRLQLIAISPP